MNKLTPMMQLTWKKLEPILQQMAPLADEELCGKVRILVDWEKHEVIFKGALASRILTFKQLKPLMDKIKFYE